MKSHISEPAQESVIIQSGSIRLDGFLGIPARADGIVLFAHGSGSGRLSPRNQAVARHFHRAGLATLLFDLLMPIEADDRQKVFDIDLLAERLLLATQWLAGDSRTASLPLGYFGASTGAGAALQAAAKEPAHVQAVVSRGGRPELAAAHLPNVIAPTLLLVGGHDGFVIELNRSALGRLSCVNELVIIPGAGHLFEEPGTLEQAAERACQWFLRYLTPVLGKQEAKRESS